MERAPPRQRVRSAPDDPAADVPPVEAGFVAALAKVLEHLCATAPSQRLVSRFDAVSPPQMTIKAYLQRLETYFTCSPECLVLSLIYVDRVVKRYPEFRISHRSIHRLLLTSLLLAAKFFDDLWYPNSYYAKVGGVHLRELNQLEVELLALLGWDLYVAPAEFALYHDRVMQAAGPPAPEPEPHARCADAGSDGRAEPDAASETSADTAPLVGPARGEPPQYLHAPWS